MAFFDSISNGYKGGANQDWMRAAVGDSHETFLIAKAELLLANEPKILTDINVPYLDFGCGTGDFVNILNRMGAQAKLLGCDVSSGMIEEGRKRHLQSQQNFQLQAISEEGSLPFADGSFEIISAVCVFHHIPEERQLFYFNELNRILQPNGRLYIFEHNPWNPATQWVVKNDPADADAHLLSVPKTVGLMKQSGFNSIESKFCLFLPPRVPAFRKFERLFARIPVGAQYFVKGTRSSH